MRIVAQRVKRASVEIDEKIVGAIGPGLLLLLAVGRGDSQAAADFLADKVVNLRIFPDDAGKMNRSVKDIGGGILVVSQFTLYGDCRKGRRPSFDQAAEPTIARPLYEYFVERLRIEELQIETGVFQAAMEISLVNDGPVTLILESK